MYYSFKTDYERQYSARNQELIGRESRLEGTNEYIIQLSSLALML